MTSTPPSMPAFWCRRKAKSALSLLFAAGLALAGCRGDRDLAPGAPKPGSEVLNPQAILDFTTLYRQNCSGCHGARGMKGAAYPLANPEYQALADDATLNQIVSQGEPGTLMPAFAIGAGGTLTEMQIQALIEGMRRSWGAGAHSDPQSPPYRAAAAGDAAHGGALYQSVCAGCHRAGKAGSITDPNFLSLMSDQALRTIIIAGRPDLGHPDWKGQVSGRSVAAPLRDRDVTDIVAWLSSQRPHPEPDAGNAASPNGTRTQ